MQSTEHISMDHVLITGGTGFVGKSLLEAAREMLGTGRLGKVTVLSRKPEEFLRRYSEYRGQGWLNVQYGDVLKYETLPTKTGFSHILHAASEATGITGMSNIDIYQQIVDGTKNMLTFAVKQEGARFLLTSSGAVYGKVENGAKDGYDENTLGGLDICDVKSAYGLGKRNAEFLCTLYREEYGLNTVVARCFAFVGPYLPLTAHYAIGNFIHDALYGENIRVFSDGLAVRSYLDQSDMAEWLWVLLEDGRCGETYNVGSEYEIRIKDLALLVRDILSPGKEVIVEGCINGGGERSRYVPAVKKIRLLHGLRQRISIGESIRRTGSYHMNRC